MRSKDRIASGLGSVLEWYDCALYGFFAPLIATLYFPSNIVNVGFLKTFSVFAVGFFSRPLGALFFGYLGDKFGRIKSLKLTPLLITCPTLFLALLPTYQEIGILAPIVLIGLRIWQGICIGGEYANNIVYLCESAKPKNIYLFGSIGSCTGSCGIFLASTIAASWYHIFPSARLLAGGWRLSFFLSLILGITAYLMRRNMLETPIFTKLQMQGRPSNSFLLTYKYQWRDCLISCGLTFLPATSFYYVFMFLPNFLVTLGFTTKSILGDNALSLLLRLLIIPLLGYTADKIGGITIARLSCILFLLLSFPLFYGIIYEKSTMCVYIFSLLTTLNAATTPGLLVELLKPSTRCLTLSFTFNFSFGVLGGLVPVFNFWMLSHSVDTFMSVYYLMTTAAITLISTFFFKKNVSL